MYSVESMWFHINTMLPTSMINEIMSFVKPITSMSEQFKELYNWILNKNAPLSNETIWLVLKQTLIPKHVRFVKQTRTWPRGTGYFILLMEIITAADALETLGLEFNQNTKQFIEKNKNNTYSFPCPDYTAWMCPDYTAWMCPEIIEDCKTTKDNIVFFEIK